MNLCYSVIIPFRGDMAILEKVLHSLENTQYSKKEIIVVNDGTSYDFGTIMKKYQCDLINLPQRCGPSFARNTGAKAANFEYLVFLDSDIVVPKDCFVKINDFLKDHQSVSLVNCLVSSYCPYSDFFSQYTNMSFQYNILKEGRNDVFTPLCVVAAKSFWEVGGFDESVPSAYADDTILGWKLRHSGHKFDLIEKVEVQHYKRMTLLKFILLHLLHAYYLGKYFIIYRRVLKSLKGFYKKEGPLTIVAILLFLTLVFLNIFSFSINVFIFLGLFMVINFNFLKFLLRDKGFLFMFKSIWATVFQYLVFFIGAVIGIGSGFCRRSISKNLAP